MHRVREALVEVFIIFLVGGLIGAVLAVVSNLFVMGVQWFGQQREASDLLSFTLGDQSLSFSSVLFLWAAAAVVVFIKTGLGISRWAGPADSMYAAHQVHQPLDIKTGFASTLADSCLEWLLEHSQSSAQNTSVKRHQSKSKDQLELFLKYSAPLEF